MKTLQITLIAIFAACFVSCSDNKAAENATETLVETFQKIPDIIKDVSDVESAKAANEKLSAIGTELNAVLIANKDAKVTQDKLNELTKTMTEQSAAVQQKVQEKITSLTATDPAAAMELSKGFQAFAENMMKGVQ